MAPGRPGIGEVLGRGRPEQPAMAMAGTTVAPAPALDPQAQEVLDRLEAGRPKQNPSPLPNKVEPTRPTVTPKPTAHRGVDR